MSGNVLRRIRDVARFLFCLPLYSCFTLPAAVHLLRKRSVRIASLARSEAAQRKGQGSRPGVVLHKPGTLLPGGGRQVVYGESLHFLAGHWAPPGNSERFREVCLSFPAEAGSATIFPEGAAHTTGDHRPVKLGVAFLNNDGWLRRELLFALSVGSQVASAGLRLCGGALPPLRLAAVVLPYLVDRKSLLLTKRAPRGGSYNSMWVFPGGAVDAQETPELCASRELNEETGLELRLGSLKFLCAFQARLDVACMTFLMLIYTAEVDSSAMLQLDPKEVAQAAFLTGDAVDKLLAGDCEGEVHGVAHGTKAALQEQPVPLRDLQLARDSLCSIGPGIGAGHWMALQLWQSTSAM